MAQEDKGLVVRGLLLLSAIGVLVLIVLVIIFVRPHTPPVQDDDRELSETPASAPGFDIRYNAAATLARRGSDRVPWHLIREMLDARQQLRNNRIQDADGNAVYDEAAARATTLSALRALAAWHDKRKAENKSDVPAELRSIYGLVDKLKESPYIELKVQAEKASATFFR